MMMRSLFFPIVVATLYTAFLFSCAHKTQTTGSLDPNPQVDAQPSRLQNAQEAAAAQLSAAYVGTLDFVRGDVKLNEKDQKKIEALLQDANAKGGIKEIKVMAWADQSYPSMSTKKLSPLQLELAAQRARNIKNYISQNFSSLKVDTYNMAERPMAIEEFFKTSDSKVKNALEAAGVTARPEMVSASSSRSLVMIISK